MGTSKPNDYLKECIADAIIVLIKERPIEKISIDEIVKKPGWDVQHIFVPSIQKKKRSRSNL